MLSFDPTISDDFGMPASLCEVSGQRLVITDHYADLLMRPKGDLLGCLWQALAHPDDRKAIALPFNRLVVAGEPLQERCRMLRSDGQWLSLTFNAFRSRAEDTGRVLIQSHVKVEDPPLVGLIGGDAVDTVAIAGYVRDFALQLGHLAGQRRMTMLQHLLSLVSAEAGQELTRLVEEQRVSDQPPHMVH